jgi:TPR repeat protein
VKFYLLAANHGDAVAQFNLGVRHQNGKGVAHDDEEVQLGTIVWQQFKKMLEPKDTSVGVKRMVEEFPKISQRR